MMDLTERLARALAGMIRHYQADQTSIHWRQQYEATAVAQAALTEFIEARTVKKTDDT